MCATEHQSPALYQSQERGQRQIGYRSKEAGHGVSAFNTRWSSWPQISTVHFKAVVSVAPRIPSETVKVAAPEGTHSDCVAKGDWAPVQAHVEQWLPPWQSCGLYYQSSYDIVLLLSQSLLAAALQSLKDAWQNTPPSWGSGDPCGTPWEGVTCKDSRVTALGLSTMSLKGKLSGDIGGLNELISLDLSFNPELTGSLTPRLGDLQNLNILILAGCGFTGNIPDELGNLAELSFLALNSNNLTGNIPPSLGKLSNVYWLDLAENQLTGTIPISTPTSPGLDLLLKAKHFHFNKNQLSGPIPSQLFSSDMVLIHVLFDGNQLNGTIPDSIGEVQTLEVLRLDRNALTGKVPTNLNNLTSVVELNLARNQLTGPLPNLTGMTSLNYVDLSNNSFVTQEAPEWFSTLPSLTTLVIEHGSLQGPLPSKIFSYQQIEQVLLKNNAFSGQLDMGESLGPQLQLVDLQNNNISSVTLTAQYTSTLILVGNPVCSALSNTNYCQLQQPTSKAYSTSVTKCGNPQCPYGQKLSPQRCECAYPYEGTLYFRAPSFKDSSDVNRFQELEMSLWVKLGLTPGSVFIQDPFFNVDDYLQVQLALFPPTGKYFNRTEIIRIGFDLSNQTYKPPKDFGPYLFIASPYPFPDGDKGTSLNSSAVAGIVTGCSLLVLGLFGVGIYAIRQKKRAEKALGLSRPFASWAPSGKDSGGAPQLKGARWFSYDELKKCTNNFSESNEIGSGGYGKVYRGMLSEGQVVAIKRAQQGSMQGGLEFKTEIELLSRVHHKNLVGLVGFCFEQGEQMLVYEFMANGTLRESLSGKYIVREVRMAMDKNDEEHYGLKEIMDPAIRNSTNLVGFGRIVDLAMQCVEESAAERPTMSEVVKEIETILQNDGMNTNSTSASSSATDFGASRGAPRHPYNDVPKKDVNDLHAFDYSGGTPVPVPRHSLPQPLSVGNNDKAGAAEVIESTKNVVEDTENYDQLFVARAYFPSIAKLPSQNKLSQELKQNIQEFERILSESTTDTDLPSQIEKKLQKMELATAKLEHSCECHNVDKKLRQILDMTEDEANFHMRQSAFLYQLAVQTMPKSLHCLSMKLTVEYFNSSLHDMRPSPSEKFSDPTLHHYVIFSNNILASSVVINSTVTIREYVLIFFCGLSTIKCLSIIILILMGYSTCLQDSGNLVIHVLTDEQNYFAMKLWFFRNTYREASIQVLNIEHLDLDYHDKAALLSMFLPVEFHVSFLV
ncbi:hypothetical protein GH714_003943 [Hevea brasiliensis]|uniref:non-specific serine/threonine protein kinase n=1 Tax=Hevea brasiliensis TaxID=3981 RepID=A0A6A6KGJ9_HEVBR|nr:hypothetical protein GH714_003943 [Hevea brasiliensis]